MDNAYVRSAQEVLNHFGTEEQIGLSDAGVADSRQKHGRNGISASLEGAHGLNKC